MALNMVRFSAWCTSANFYAILECAMAVRVFGRTLLSAIVLRQKWSRGQVEARDQLRRNLDFSARVDRISLL